MSGRFSGSVPFPASHAASTPRPALLCPLTAHCLAFSSLLPPPSYCTEPAHIPWVVAQPPWQEIAGVGEAGTVANWGAPPAHTCRERLLPAPAMVFKWECGPGLLYFQESLNFLVIFLIQEF